MGVHSQPSLPTQARKDVGEAGGEKERGKRERKENSKRSGVVTQCLQHKNKMLKERKPLQIGVFGKANEKVIK